MRSTIYRQYDSRWGNLPYPTYSYKFAMNGCGCCAVTHVVIEQDKYKYYTPATVRKYMVQFATKGRGTLWSGITKGLKHYGFGVYVYTPHLISSAFKRLNKGHHIGVLLMDKGRKGGITWTTGGHYIAFTGYKIVGGKHYFYIKDSGARRNDGWHCYETTMKGLVKQMWVATLPKPKAGRYFTVGKTYTAQQTMNVRTGGSMKYKKVGTLEKGAKVTCLQTSKDGRWIKIAPYRWVCGRGITKEYLK